MNWWSPVDKNAVKGRWLDLEAGVVRSTEIIYEKKAQVEDADNNEDLATTAATTDADTNATATVDTPME